MDRWWSGWFSCRVDLKQENSVSDQGSLLTSKSNNLLDNPLFPVRIGAFQILHAAVNEEMVFDLLVSKLPRICT